MRERLDGAAPQLAASRDERLRRRRSGEGTHDSHPHIKTSRNYPYTIHIVVFSASSIFPIPKRRRSESTSPPVVGHQDDVFRHRPRRAADQSAE
eukprot:scaffold16697_cov95-Isochrysis_galbana.AAC.2